MQNYFRYPFEFENFLGFQQAKHFYSSVGVAVVVAKRQIAFISTLDASDSKTIPKPQRSQCLP